MRLRLDEIPVPKDNRIPADHLEVLPVFLGVVYERWNLNTTEALVVLYGLYGITFGKEQARAICTSERNIKDARRMLFNVTGTRRYTEVLLQFYDVLTLARQAVRTAGYVSE